MFEELFKEYSISEGDIDRIKNFINENELEIHINEDNILRFFISTEEGFSYQIYKTNETYIVVEINNKGYVKYINYSSLHQFLEQLCFVENSKPKVYFYPINQEAYAYMTFDNKNYTDEWGNYLMNSDNWKLEDSYNFHDEKEYKYLVYEQDINLSVISPCNTLHDVSPLNSYNPTKISKLHFEIHPVLLTEKNEVFLCRILINTDEKFKEYINYKIMKKKGLKLFLEELFNNKNPFIMF
jgi:hypothetical protein